MAKISLEDDHFSATPWPNNQQFNKTNLSKNYFEPIENCYQGPFYNLRYLREEEYDFSCEKTSRRFLSCLLCNNCTKCLSLIKI